MNTFQIRGWCPDAWHPMAAGDGLLVRIRPRLARLTREQLLGLCDAALAHGNGQIDLTNRASLQIRGVSEAAMPALLDRLIGLGLVSPDPVAESRHNLLVAPDWREGDDTVRIARDLAARLHELPELPGKVGFVVDAGVELALAGEAGDFRVERGRHGGLILRAAGREHGAPLEPGAEAEALIGLAHWFAGTGGPQARRMARHTAPLPGFAEGKLLPVAAARPVTSGAHRLGSALGVAFGQSRAEALARLAAADMVAALRITPWRLVLVEGQAEPAGFIRDPGDPLLHADACPGKPLCPQATVETRPLARRIASRITGHLHVSGCAKGCARASAASVTLTGRDGRFDLATGARAGAPPILPGLTAAEVITHFGAA